MSDDGVTAALRSDARLVVVEAPAGCGKTHQGADFARFLAASKPRGRLLILTHTHAACAVFAERTAGAGAYVEIRTIDSLIVGIATAYHAGLGLPRDVNAWIRVRDKTGYQEVAVLVAALLSKHPMIAAALARRYPVVICDEHQDSSGDQHALVMAMHDQGAKVCIFGDPMQKIFKETEVRGAAAPYDWDALASRALFEKLDTPHRWAKGCHQLGKWTLRARELLKAGKAIDLRTGRPPSVRVLRADNQAAKLDFRLTNEDRNKVRDFTDSQQTLLTLTRYNDTARAIRAAVLFRQVRLWEGHGRAGLDRYVDSMLQRRGDPAGIASAIVDFMDQIGKGFSPSAFGDRLVQEAREGCVKPCSGIKPPKIQELARILVSEPNHRGAANLLRRVFTLRKERDPTFADVEVDCREEFFDAIRLGAFEDIEAGLIEVTHRRTYARPKPPDRSVSTIHRAKGLECSGVALMPCDSRNFPDKPDARCLLYVALSRAKDELLLVIPNKDPSPLLLI